MEHEFLFGIFRPENMTTFLDVPLLAEGFRWNDPNSRVPYLLSNRIFRNLFVNGKQHLFLKSLTTVKLQ